MSAKVKSSKKQVKEEVSDFSETEIKQDVKPKKTGSKKNQVKEIEPENLVSDSDNSFIKQLDNLNNDSEVEEKQVEEPEKKTYQRKQKEMCASKLEQIIKSDFSNKSEEEKIKLSKLTQILNNKITSSLCGKEIDVEELVSDIKDLDIKDKKSKKEKKAKKVNLDEEGNPIKKDTSNSYLNTKHLPYPQVNDFMGHEHGTLVSPVEVQKSLRQFTAEQKDLQNENNVTGKLKTLLEFIVPQRLQVDTDNSNVNIIPTKINNNSDIVRYAAWSFPLMSKPKKVKAPKSNDQ